MFLSPGGVSSPGYCRPGASDFKTTVVATAESAATLISVSAPFAKRALHRLFQLLDLEVAVPDNAFGVMRLQGE